MSAYDKVLLARAKGRATGLSYIDHIFEDFVELHGDRRFADDPAIVGGIATLGGKPVTVIAMEKGSDMKDKVRRNFGAPNPEGYRKALRLMKQAEKFRRPVVCFVDTSGAYCGLGAEERGQGQAIAENLVEMAGLKTPIVSILVGEGGSGGALALAVADQVWILENAVYSVISPEGVRVHPVEGRQKGEGRRRVPAPDRPGHGGAGGGGEGHPRGEGLRPHL